MTYVLSDNDRSKFLAIPEVACLKVLKDGGSPRVALLVKTSSLRLKYLHQLKSFRVIVTRLTSRGVLYLIEIKDDPTNPSYIWSLVETEEELEALNILSEIKSCVAYFYNEIAVNLYWAEINLSFYGTDLNKVLISSTLQKVGPDYDTEHIGSFIEDFHKEKLSGKEVSVMSVVPEVVWKKMLMVYLPTRSSIGSSELHFDKDEGSQQEQLVLWLVDELSPEGAVLNPLIGGGSKVRELSDALFTDDKGYFLVESKTLSVLDRSDLPDREKLKKNILKNVSKAYDQIIGAVNNVKKGSVVTDAKGNEIEVIRDKQNQVIILVPELSLLADSNEWGKKAIKEFYDETGSVFQILDPKELLRLVQGAHMVSLNYGGAIPLLMAFRHLLTERVKSVLEQDTVYLDFIIRTRS